MKRSAESSGAPEGARASLGWAVLAVTAGAMAVLLSPRLPPLWLSVSITVPALLPWRGRARYALIVLGVLLAAWNAQRVLADRWPVTRDGDVVTVRGTIADLPDRSHASYGTTWRFLFVPDAGQAVPQHIRVAWYDSHRAMAGGQCWRLALRMKAPHGSADPGAFDYEGWLFAHAIGATASVKHAQRCHSSRRHPLLSVRTRLRADLDGWLAGTPGHALVLALMLGDRSGLDERDWAVFRATGTSHLVAVAGLHLGIIAAAAFFLMRWVWVLWPALPRRLPAQVAGSIAAVTAASSYAALSGFALPAVRATLMLVLGAVALWLGGRRSLVRALMLAWLCIVLANPLTLLGASLWLSFGAVALIAWIAMDSPRGLSRWRLLLRLQLGLSLGLVPLTLWFFGSASLVAPLANLVVVPLAALLLPALFVAVLVAGLHIPGGVVLLKAASTAWWGVFEGLRLLASLAPAGWGPHAVSPVPLALVLFGIVLWLAPRGLPLRVLGTACLLPLFWTPSLAPPVGAVRLTVLDVGQGLSAIVRTHAHALLFDAGPRYPSGFDMGEAVVVPALQSRGIDRLDVLMVSHADMDHRGGVPAVRRRVDVDAMRGATTSNPCVDGQHWRWDGVDFTVLNPPAGATGSRNDRGCVLRVAAGTHAILLPADIEAAAEHALVRRHALSLPADVLVAPHHGSAGSSSPAFVDAVSPQVVIYPAGWENRFDFPRPQPVARYTAIGARQWQTGVVGAVTVILGPRGVGAVRAWRRWHRHLWSASPQPSS